jgi:hypothetical protein
LKANRIARRTPARLFGALSEARRLAVRTPGVTGVDVGFLYRRGERTRRVGIRFHVARKRPEEELPAREALPAAILGVTCDVLQASYAPHAISPRGHFDPVLPGISIGNVTRQKTGTLGGFARGEQGGEQVRSMNGWRLVPDRAAPEPDISIHGDSGAIWLDASTGAAVALHFAGKDHLGPSADDALVHPLSRVCRALDVQLIL